MVAIDEEARWTPGHRSRRGRPVQLSTEEREGLILDAMERVVAESGLQRASMSAIAREAGMSKRTLYEVYGCREMLFDAWVRRVRARHVRPLRKDEIDLPLAERLKRLFTLESCDRNDDGDRRLVVLRAVIAEAPQQQEVARAVLLAGAAAARQVVQRELDRAVSRNELRPCDTAEAAQLLVDMAGLNPLHILLDPDACENWKVLAPARLELAVETFLYGHAVRQDDTARAAERLHANA